LAQEEDQFRADTGLDPVGGAHRHLGIHHIVGQPHGGAEGVEDATDQDHAFADAIGQALGDFVAPG
jgi:hypothetical protein